MHLRWLLLICVLTCSSVHSNDEPSTFFISLPHDKANFTEVLKRCLSLGMVPANYPGLLDIKGLAAEMIATTKGRGQEQFWISQFERSSELHILQMLRSTGKSCATLTYNPGWPYEFQSEYCNMRFRYVCQGVPFKNGAFLRSSIIGHTFTNLKTFTKWVIEKLKKAGHYTDKKLGRIITVAREVFHKMKLKIGDVVNFSKKKAAQVINNIIDRLK